ncbi:hypothetical protein PENANT_c393G02298, partial [Penicillium antarcticum]
YWFGRREWPSRFLGGFHGRVFNAFGDLRPRVVPSWPIQGVLTRLARLKPFGEALGATRVHGLLAQLPGGEQYYTATIPEAPLVP